jgi:predicted dehydrogenase
MDRAGRNSNNVKLSVMRALIASLGSIGRRHLANLRLIEPDTHITVWHQHSNHSGNTESLFPADCVVYRLEDALGTQPDVALITCPASRHIETGLALVEHGIHLFIEKPLSNTLSGVDRLLSLCHRHSLVLMVGYNFRFYLPMQIMRQALLQGQIGRVLSARAEVGQYLPDWRPGSDYRQSVSARSELGGGVLLELSHELDYVRWLVGEVETVSAHIGHLSNLETDVEDMAEIILQFDRGAIGSVHLDMTQRVATRTCRIIGTEGTLVWDGMSHQVRLFSVVTNTWTDLYPAQVIDRNDMYIAELRHFLDCARGDTTPSVTGEDGRRVLQIALAAKQSSIEQRVVKL